MLHHFGVLCTATMTTLLKLQSLYIHRQHPEHINADLERALKYLQSWRTLDSCDQMDDALLGTLSKLRTKELEGPPRNLMPQHQQGCSKTLPITSEMHHSQASLEGIFYNMKNTYNHKLPLHLPLILYKACTLHKLVACCLYLPCSKDSIQQMK